MSATDTTARIIAMLESRAASGLAKYGVTIDRDDLKFAEWATHAQEEALDLAQYLERAKAKWAEQESALDGLVKLILGDDYSDPHLSIKSKQVLAVTRVMEMNAKWPEREAEIARLRGEIGKAYFEGFRDGRFGELQAPMTHENSRAKRVAEGKHE